MAYTALYDIVKAKSEHWPGDMSQVAHHFLSCWPPERNIFQKDRPVIPGRDIKLISLTCYPQAGVVRVVFRAPEEILKLAFNAFVNVNGLIPTILPQIDSEEVIDAIITALGEIRYEGKRNE